MRAKALIAPINTIIRGCFIAIMAAIKNVLSPISETRIRKNVFMKASIKFKCSSARIAFGDELV